MIVDISYTYKVIIMWEQLSDIPYIVLRREKCHLQGCRRTQAVLLCLALKYAMLDYG